MERDRDHKVRNPERDSVGKSQAKHERKAEEGVGPVRGGSTEAETPVGPRGKQDGWLATPIPALPGCVVC